MDRIIRASSEQLLLARHRGFQMRIWKAADGSREGVSGRKSPAAGE
jgi:hypothetical protein